MNDLVRRSEILFGLNVFSDDENGNEHFLNGIETAKEIVEDAIAVDAVPAVHGHWIFKKDVIGTKYECSECGHSDSKTTAIRGHYCWYCGAKMDGEVEEELQRKDWV